MKNKDVMFLHASNDNWGEFSPVRVTLACREVEEGILISSACCSDLDNFCKRKGRDLATKRLYTKEDTIFELVPHGDRKKYRKLMELNVSKIVSKYKKKKKEYFEKKF